MKPVISYPVATMCTSRAEAERVEDAIVASGRSSVTMDFDVPEKMRVNHVWSVQYERTEAECRAKFFLDLPEPTQLTKDFYGSSTALENRNA